MGYDIRVASPRERETLAGLIGEFRDELGSDSPSDPAIRRFLTQHLGSSPELGFVLATEDGRGVGYVHYTLSPSLWASGPAMWVNDVFVTRSHRRVGLARRLLDAILATAESGSVHEVSLATNEGNGAAQELYRSAGFEPVTEARWNGGRELLFSRALPKVEGEVAPAEPVARPAIWVGHTHMTVPEPTAAHDYYVAIGARSVMCGAGFSLIEVRGGTHIEFGQGAHEPGDAPFDLMVDDLETTRAKWSAAGLDVSDIISGDPHSVFVLTDLNDYRVIVFDSHVVGPV